MFKKFGALGALMIAVYMGIIYFFILIPAIGIIVEMFGY